MSKRFAESKPFIRVGRAGKREWGVILVLLFNLSSAFLYLKITNSAYYRQIPKILLVEICSPDLIILDSPLFSVSSPWLTLAQGGDAHPLDRDQHVGTIWIPSPPLHRTHDKPSHLIPLVFEEQRKPPPSRCTHQGISTSFPSCAIINGLLTPSAHSSEETPLASIS